MHTFDLRARARTRVYTSLPGCAIRICTSCYRSYGVVDCLYWVGNVANSTLVRKFAQMTTDTTVEVAAQEILVAFSEKGKTHEFRAGSQRAIWFNSLRQYEGLPLASWLAAVATEVPAQRAKVGHKSPHKGGMGFLRRFALEGLLAAGVYKE